MDSSFRDQGRMKSVVGNILEGTARTLELSDSQGAPFARGMSTQYGQLLRDIQMDQRKIKEYLDNNNKEYFSAMSAVKRQTGRVSKNENIRRLYFEGQEEGVNYNSGLKALTGASPEGLEYINLIVKEGNPFADIQMGAGRVARVPISNAQFMAIGEAREKRRLNRLNIERQEKARMIAMEGLRQNMSSLGLSDENTMLLQNLLTVSPEKARDIFGKLTEEKIRSGENGVGSLLNKENYNSIAKNFNDTIKKQRNFDFRKINDDMERLQ